MNEFDQSLVSVCLASYNNASFLRQALDSILAQTYSNIEIIVGDNASTDDTALILKSYHDSRIRCICQEKTIGCLDHWNVLVKEARGDYIAVYHADDIYEKDIVEREFCSLHDHSNVGAVFCLDRLIDEHDEFVREGIKLSEYLEEKGILDFKDVLTEMARRSSSFLVAPTFMVKRKVFEHVGFFDENQSFGESIGGAGDTEMWIRIAQYFDIGLISERLINRRISRKQGSRQYESSRTERANHFCVVDHFLENNPQVISEKIKAQYRFNKQWDDVLIVANMVKQGNRVDAFKKVRGFCWKDFLRSGCCDRKNIVKFFLMGVLRASFFFGVPQLGVKLIDRVKLKYNKF